MCNISCAYKNNTRGTEMKKVLKTLNLLFWGNLAVVAMTFYAILIMFMQVTMFFVTAIGGIWFDEDPN
jgi:hypothetical protein